MKTKNLTPILLVGIVILAVFAFFMMRNSGSDDFENQVNEAPLQDSTNSGGNQETVQGDSTQPEDSANKNSTSQYIEYDSTALTSTSSSRRVLFFYASWCPTCRPVDKDLREKTSILPSDVTVIRVNYNDPQTDNEEKELAKKYAVTYQHTFVQIDNQGNELAKWNGGSADEIQSHLQ